MDDFLVEGVVELPNLCAPTLNDLNGLADYREGKRSSYPEKIYASDAMGLNMSDTKYMYLFAAEDPANISQEEVFAYLRVDENIDYLLKLHDSCDGKGVAFLVSFLDYYCPHFEHFNNAHDSAKLWVNKIFEADNDFAKTVLTHTKCHR